MPADRTPANSPIGVWMTAFLEKRSPHYTGE
jgi:hypothetical protein